jgi:hypothetical protein
MFPVGLSSQALPVVGDNFISLCFVLFTMKTNLSFSFLDFLHTYLPMKMEQTEFSERLAYKFQTLGNYPEESKQKYVLVVS